MAGKRDEELHTAIQQLQTMKVEVDERMMTAETIKGIERRRIDAATAALDFLENIKEAEHEIFVSCGRAYVMTDVDSVMKTKKDSITTSQTTIDNVTSRQESMINSYKEKENNVREKLRAIQTKSEMADKEKVVEFLKTHQQEHLLTFYDELEAAGQEALLASIWNANIDSGVKAFKETASITSKEIKISPIPEDKYHSRRATNEEKRALYWNAGLQAIAESKVAAAVLAGGQATRLGASVPKGLLPLGLNVTKGDNLLSMQAGQIAKLQDLARLRYPDIVKEKGGKISWIVMVSDATLAETTAALAGIREEHGLTSGQVKVIKQGNMACFDNAGKVLLAEKDAVAQSPDGNGGFFLAMMELLDSPTQLPGVEHFHVYCVDNILCKVADPTFIGISIVNQVKISAKVVEKKEPHEAVGVICHRDDIGKYAVVEYSEISKELAEQRDESGELTYRAGNIANHYFNSEMLLEAGRAAKEFHRANKKIPHIDLQTGEKVKPTSPNGVKMESFIFDYFDKAGSHFCVMEVEREEEFSPLKNAEEAKRDCLSTCRAALFKEHNRRLKAAGIDWIQDVLIPLTVSYEGEELSKFKDANQPDYKGEKLAVIQDGVVHQFPEGRK